MMQSIDTMSVPQEGVGGFSLIKVGKDVRQAQNLGQAKLLKKNLIPGQSFHRLLTAKITKFQYK